MANEKIDPALRAKMIRKGNELMQKGELLKAGELFKKAQYASGLIRIADIYYFEQNKPLMAYGYYKAAGKKQMLERIHENFLVALKIWLHEDDPLPKSEENKPKITELPSAGLNLMEFRPKRK
ncbi:MAG: hypothetical protein D6767_08825 [Candidatus Hydrogenedentota bacterium]|nr:MAG: hypothetical protein D6767_08825 [Candidatus Hydrogenedentota bacterium]